MGDGPFSFNRVPYGSVMDIIKRMETKSFLLMMRTCKWVGNAIQQNRSQFIKDVEGEIAIYESDVRDKDAEWIRNRYIANRSYFRLSMASFREFARPLTEPNTVRPWLFVCCKCSVRLCKATSRPPRSSVCEYLHQDEELRRVLAVFKDAHVLTDWLHLDKCRGFPEMFEAFKPRQYSVNHYRGQRYTIADETFPPPGLDLIRVTSPECATLLHEVNHYLLPRSKQIHLTWRHDIDIACVLGCMRELVQDRLHQDITVHFGEDKWKRDLEKYAPTQVGFYQHKCMVGRKRNRPFYLIVHKTGDGISVGRYTPDHSESSKELFCVYTPTLGAFESRFLDVLFPKNIRNITSRAVISDAAWRYFE